MAAPPHPLVGFLVRALLGASLALLACQSGQKGPPDRPASDVVAAQQTQPAPTTAPARTDAKVASADSAASTGSGGSPGQVLGKIYLQELGEALPKEDLELALTALAYYFPNPVVVLPRRDLPEAAYYPARQRYRAEKLLDHLVEQTPEDAQVVVGLTAVDISTTKPPYEDWGILGLATVSGRECVISRFRAQRDAKNEVHARQRLAKVVVHEIGHTLGLAHCPHYSCLMEDGKGSVLTTDHELDFCPTCRAAVGTKLLLAQGSLPWDPPAHLP